MPSQRAVWPDDKHRRHLVGRKVLTELSSERLRTDVMAVTPRDDDNGCDLLAEVRVWEAQNGRRMDTRAGMDDRLHLCAVDVLTARMITSEGRAVREWMEASTNAQQQPVLDAIGRDEDDLLRYPAAVAAAIVERATTPATYANSHHEGNARTSTPSAPAPPDDTFPFMTRNGERGEYRHWVGVLNQGPLTSATNVFRLEHMLAARPSTATPQTPHPKVGDVAPDFEVECTDGRSIRLSEFRGKPVIMRLTRAVTGAII